MAAASTRAVVQYSRHGDSSVLEYIADAPVPALKKGQARYCGLRALHCRQLVRATDSPSWRWMSYASLALPCLTTRRAPHPSACCSYLR